MIIDQTSLYDGGVVTKVFYCYVMPFDNFSSAGFGIALIVSNIHQQLLEYWAH